MTFKEAYEEAGRKKKGLIISGEIGGRHGEQRLESYIEKHPGVECSITAETKGFVIVEQTRRK